MHAERAREVNCAKYAVDGWDRRVDLCKHLVLVSEIINAEQGWGKRWKVKIRKKRNRGKGGEP